MSDLISVIVPAFNAEKYIECCLNSLINQTHKNLEIIVVDDGSVDQTAAKVLKIEDPRIKLIQQQNKGQSAARNEGLGIARGKYISFIDSDDYIDPDYYEKLYTCGEQLEADLVMAETKIIDGCKTSVLKNSIKQENKFINKLKLLHNGGPCDKLYRADLINENKLSFFEGRMYEDSLFGIQTLYYSTKMASISGTCYNYIIYGNSTSHSPDKALKRYNDSLFIAEQIMQFLHVAKMENEEVKAVVSFIKRNLVPPECGENQNYQKRMREICKNLF